MDSPSFQVLSLCAGIAGIDLGFKLAVPGARTVCYVENEATACEKLVARMEDGALDEAPIWTNLKTFDGKPWRGRIHCLTSGYPCQPFSCAGKQRGTKDPRHLWPHVARIIREVEPEWVFLENVANHLRIGFRQVAQELRAMGYGIEAGLFSAAEVGAPHLRKRLFVLAHASRHERAGSFGQDGGGRRIREAGDALADAKHGIESERTRSTGRQSGQRASERSGIGVGGEDVAYTRRESETRRSGLPGKQDRRWAFGQPAGSDFSVADTEQSRRNGSARQGFREVGPALQATRFGSERGAVADAGSSGREAAADSRQRTSTNREASARVTRRGLSLFPPGPEDLESWRELLADHPALEPAIRRAPNGSAPRVDRLRTLGNGVVPLVAALALRTLGALHSENAAG